MKAFMYRERRQTAWPFRKAVFLAAFLCSLYLTEGRSLAGPVSGTALWLEADVGVGTDGSGNLTWQDQSGNGHNAASPSIGNNPTFVNNAFATGKPTLRFDGAPQFLNITGQVLTNTQQYTVMAVVNDQRAAGDGNFREVFSNWSPTNTTTSVFLGTANTNPVRARFTDDMGGATDPINTQTGVGAITNPSDHFIFSGESTGTDGFVFQNASLIAQKGSPISPRDVNVNDGLYRVGTQGGFELWQGDIAELLVYDRALTSSEFQQNLDYLDAKYFAPSSVPEPASLALLGFGGLGLLGYGWRRRRTVA
jgi:hypothetical protein